MVIGVLSDTHLSPAGEINESLSGRELIKDSNLAFLYNLLKGHFRGVEAVIHAGDIIDISVLKLLEDFGEVYAVAGNMDPAPLKTKLPRRRVVRLPGFSIGIIHGSGSADGLSYKVRGEFAGENPDCIVFGHSHYPYDRVEDGILMFNPGSAVDRRYASKRSIGLLHLEETIWGEHIYF